MTTITRELIAAYLNGEVKTLTNSEQKELARIALVSLDADSDSDSNSHPAHGPLSNDRLHRIREILGKAAAQSDGGNLGYAMSDAVRAFDELLEVRKAAPVAWTEKCEISNMQATGLYLRGFPDNSQGRDIALYTAPPAPVAIDERAAFNAWNNEDNLPIAGVGAKNAAWLAWQARAKLGSPPATVLPDVVGKLLAILDRHTVQLGWGEKPVTLAELVIYRDGSDELVACRAAMLNQEKSNG